MSVPMNIDWQQILLHVLNFAILAGGLYILLYKPVKKFMDNRTAAYEKEAAEAAEHLQHAAELEEGLRQRLEAADADIAQKTGELTEAAAAEAAATVRRAEAEATSIVENARKQAEQEKQKILDSAGAEIAELAADAADKLMKTAISNAYDSFLDRAEESVNGNS